MGILTIDRSANKMYTHALLVLAMALAAECASERAYGHHETTTTTTTTMKPEPYKKHDNTFYHRPSYKTYNGYNSHHHNNGYNSYHHNNEYTNYHHMEPRIYSPYQNLHKRSPTFGDIELDLPTVKLIKGAALAGGAGGLLLASTIPAGTFTLGTIGATSLALGR